MDAFTIGSAAISIAAPWISSTGFTFSFVGNTVIRLLMIVLVLVATRQGGLQGLFTMLAVYSLLLERNYHLLLKLPMQPATKEPMLIPQHTPYMNIPVEQVPLEEPSQEVHQYDEQMAQEVKEVQSPNESQEVPAEYQSANDIKAHVPIPQSAPSSEEAIDFYAKKGLL
jgi:hypothetical protein